MTSPALDNARDRLAAGTYARGEKSRHKLTEAQVREIKRDYIRLHCHKTNAKELAERYGVCTGTVTAIMRGDAWTHIT